MFRARVATLVLLAQFLQPLAAVAGEAAPGAPQEAQEDTTAASGPSANALALMTIPPGGKIRVLMDGVLTAGTFERFVADTLWMLTPPATLALTMPADSIDGLWERGTAIQTGAMVGVGIGLAASLILVRGDTVDPEDVLWTEEEADNTFRAMGITLAGGILGALIGRAIPRWHQKIPAK